MPDEAEAVFSFEKEIQEKWASILELIQRDLAYVWIPKVQADFHSLQEEFGKLQVVLTRIRYRYQFNKELYAHELGILKDLFHLLDNVEAKNVWVTQFNRDIRKLVADLEKEKQESLILNREVTQSEWFKLLFPHNAYRWRKLRGWRREDPGNRYKGSAETSYNRFKLYLISHWKETDAFAMAAHPRERLMLKILFELSPLIPIFGFKEVGTASVKIAATLSPTYEEIRLPNLMERVVILGTHAQQFVNHRFVNRGIAPIAIDLIELDALFSKFHGWYYYFSEDTIFRYFSNSDKLLTIVQNIQTEEERSAFIKILPDKKYERWIWNLDGLILLQQSVQRQFFIVIFECLGQCTEFCNKAGMVVVGMELRKVLPSIDPQFLTMIPHHEPTGKGWWTHICDISSLAFFIEGCKGLLVKLDDIDRMAAVFVQQFNGKSPRFVQAVCAGLLKGTLESWEHLEALCNIAGVYFDLLKDTFYAYAVISQNLYKLAPLDTKLNRLSFSKTGSRLIPLGGKLAGLLLRIISQPSFEAWKKVYEAGIPCEEIIRTYPQKNKEVMVVTRACGDGMEHFLKRHPELKEEVELQKKEIDAGLRRVKVYHGHRHVNNYVVEMVNGKPIVRIIDFDEAFIDPSGVHILLYDHNHS